MVDKARKQIVRVGEKLASHHPLEEAIVKGLTTSDPVFRDRLRLHAGDVAWCPRRAVLYHHVDPAIRTIGDASGKFYMAIGSSIHRVVTSALTNQGLLLFSEYKIPEMGLGLGGYIDSIILLGDKIRIVEVKSCGSSLPLRIKPEHSAQAGVYSTITGIPSIVLYVSRSVADWSGRVLMRAIENNVTEAEQRRIFMSIILASLYTKAGKLPRIPTHLESEKDCRYCPFASICWRDMVAPIGLPSDDERNELVETAKTGLERLWSDRTVRTHGILKFIQERGALAARAALTRLEWNDAVSL